MTIKRSRRLGLFVLLFFLPGGRFALAAGDPARPDSRAMPDTSRLPSSPAHVGELRNVLQGVQGDQPGSGAVEAGWKAATDMFGHLGANLGVAENMGVGALANINNAMGELGLALAFFQLALNYSSENPAPAVVDFTKSLSGYGLGKWGTKAIKISMFGVYLMDEALKLLATEAIRGRHDLYERAYRYYYREQAHRSANDWRAIVRGMIANAASEAEVAAALEKEIDTYVNQFWNNRDAMTWAFDEVRTRAEERSGRRGWHTTYMGGENPRMEREISNVLRWEIGDLLQRTVLPRLQHEMIEEERAEAIQAAERVADALNQVYVVQVRVVARRPDGSQRPVAGIPVRLVTERSQDAWSGQTNAQGVWPLRCTTYGFINARASRTIVAEAPVESGTRTYEQTFDFGAPGSPVTVVIELDEDPALREEVLVLLKEGFNHEQINELEEAIAIYEQAQTLLPQPAVARRIEAVRREIERRKKEAERVAALATKDGDIPIAISSDPTLKALEAERDRVREETRSALLSEGFEMERRDNLAGAMAKYEDAQRIRREDRVDDRIRQLRQEIARRQEQAGREQQERQASRLEEMQRRQQAQQEQMRLEQEEDARRQEQARREQARKEQEMRRRQSSGRPAGAATHLTGTFSSPFTMGGQVVGAMELRLRHQGERINGTLVALERNGRVSHTEPVNGIVRGNQIQFNELDGVFTVSPDFNTLTARSSEGTQVFRRR